MTFPDFWPISGPYSALVRSLLNFVAAVPAPAMSLKLTMKGRLVIRRFDLESVIIDGRLNRFKGPQLVIKPELDFRQSSTSSQSRSQPTTRRRVLMVHVKDKASELEKLYLDTLLSSSGAAEPTQQHTVTCSRLECSLVFRYANENTHNQPRTLMVRFQATADLNAAIDELKASGVHVEDACVESQGLTRMAVHPQLQHFVALDQTTRHLPLAPQQPHYQGSPPVFMSHEFTPPPSSLHHSGILRSLSNPGAHSWGVPPAMNSWTLPPRPATISGIPGILEEGIYKVSRVGSSSSNRSRGRKLPTISESRDRSKHTVPTHFTRAKGFTKRRSFQRGDSQTSQTDDRKAKLVKLLSQKYSNTGGGSAKSEGVSVNEFMFSKETPNTPKEPELPAGATFSIGSTELVTTNVCQESELPCAPRSVVKLTDLEELAKNSQSRTSMLPSSIHESPLILEFVITQEGLTEVTYAWNELMERGQIETRHVDDLGEAHKIWARLGDEWVQQSQSRVAVTVGRLSKIRGET